MFKKKATPPILTRHPIRKFGNNRNTDGFSLMELMMVVLIIGIFSAVAVPSWNAFISRQRTRTVNGSVLQAFKTAQAEAKRYKADYVLEFDTAADPPEYSIYQAPPEGETVPDEDKIWEALDGGGEIEAGQIKLYVQANGTETDPDTITFDELGSVKDPEIKAQDQNTDGFTVTVSTAQDGNERCVIVQTILGAMRTAEGDDCP